MSEFKAVRQDIPNVGETVTVLDETGDVFFHVDPDRVSELVRALTSIGSGIKPWCPEHKEYLIGKPFLTEAGRERGVRVWEVDLSYMVCPEGSDCNQEWVP